MLDSYRYQWTRWLFLRSLGIISLIAFISFWVQLEGLIGSDGILPVRQFLQSVEEQLGMERYFRFPTLAWLGAGDVMLHMMAAFGIIASLALLFNIAPAFSVFLVWGLYLSLCVAGQIFMQYQWDNLLIEVSFLAIFIAPWEWKPGTQSSPKVNLVGIWLIRLLLFKLIFASGMAKLASNDATWSGLTALNYHFFTQPLPTIFGWIFHQFPDWVLKVMTFMSLVIEIAVPFLILTTRRLRQWVGLIIGSLMIVIGLTGNYGFFNLLGLLLCISLFDDQALRRVGLYISCKTPFSWSKEDYAEELSKESDVKRYLLYLYVALYLIVSITQLTNITGGKGWIPSWASKLTKTVRSTRSINSYGLFANMTTRRPEIMVQGSRNGSRWKTYQFIYKPDRIGEAPPWVQPHMPRLDWQMWFAALSNYRRNPWFVRFMVKILKDKDPVLELLKTNPFPERPPRYVRAVKYKYNFTTLKEWWETGNWWTREKQKLYVPSFSLQQLQTR